MTVPATVPPPRLYPEAAQWVPAVARSLGFDPARLDDAAMVLVGIGIRAGLAAAAVDALEEVRELRRTLDARPLAPVVPLLPCEEAE